MTEQLPITPPPTDLVLQWIGDYFGCIAGGELSDSERFLTARAAQYGADQELEACIDWIAVYQGLEHPELLIELLHAARRTRPPSLAEEALEAQQRLWDGKSTHDDWHLIRRALERLQELEDNQ